MAGAAPEQSGGSLYRHLGLQYVEGSVAGSTRRAYESVGRSWRTFRRLVGYQEYLESSDSESRKAWALIELALWCCASEGNLANTDSGKFAAVQYFHRLQVGVELPATTSVVQCALKGISRYPCSGGNAPQCSPTGFVRYAFDRGNPHPHMGSEGEGVVDVFMSELFSVGTIGRDVRRRFRGGTIRALPGTG